MLDPSVGFVPAMIVGIGVGSVLVLVGTVFAAAVSKQLTIGEVVAGFLVVLPLALAIATALFAIVYSILNVVLQPEHWTIPALQADLTGGTLTLRIVSLLLGWKAIVTVYKGLSVAPTEVTLQGDALAWKAIRPMRGRDSVDEFGTLPDGYSDSMRAYIVPFLQYGFFLTVVTLLLIVNALSLPQSFLVLLLSFALLFIVDDWVLIHDYSIALKGHLLRKHRARVTAANVLIAPTAVWVAYQSLAPGWATVAGLAIAFCVTFRYIFGVANPAEKMTPPEQQA